MMSKLRGPTVLAAAAMVVVLAGCTAAEEDSGPTSLTFAVESLPANFNPLTGGGGLLGSLAAQAVYDSLFVVDPDSAELAFLPWLAEGYTVSDDGLTMEITLREDVDFIDGAHMDAEAIAANYNAIISEDNPDAISRVIFASRYQTEIVVTGEYTLEFRNPTLPIRPFPFINQMTFIPIVSPAALEDQESLATNPVGTGPYTIDETVPEVSMSFVRNPDYWNPDAFDFDTLELQVFDDNIAALNALKSGQIDGTRLDLSSAAEAESSGFVIHEGLGVVQTLFVEDREGSIVPALGDLRVRQAMNLAFDREAIIEQINYGYGTPSSQIYRTGMEGYVDGGDDTYAYDLDRARDLMAEAGYADGFDLTLPKIALLGMSAYEPIIVQSLADIGIRVQFDDFAEAGPYVEALNNGTYPVVPWPLNYDVGIDIFNPRDGLFNPARTLIPEVAELNDVYMDGRTEEAREAAAAIGEYILDDAWYVTIVHTPTIWTTIPEVDVQLGLETLAGNFIALHLITLAD